MVSLFLIFQVILTIVITIAIMLQKSSSIGLGAYSGSNESLFGAKGPAGFLAKFTAIMGILFVLNTLALGYAYSQDSKKSIIDSVNTEALEIKQPESNATDTNTTDIIPSVPILPSK